MKRPSTSSATAAKQRTRGILMTNNPSYDDENDTLEDPVYVPKPRARGTLTKAPAVSASPPARAVTAVTESAKEPSKKLTGKRTTSSPPSIPLPPPSHTSLPSVSESLKEKKGSRQAELAKEEATRKRIELERQHISGPPSNDDEDEDDKASSSLPAQVAGTKRKTTVKPRQEKNVELAKQPSPEPTRAPMPSVSGPKVPLYDPRSTDQAKHPAPRLAQVTPPILNATASSTTTSMNKALSSLFAPSSFVPSVGKAQLKPGTMTDLNNENTSFLSNLSFSSSLSTVEPSSGQKMRLGKPGVTSLTKPAETATSQKTLEAPSLSSIMAGFNTKL